MLSDRLVNYRVEPKFKKGDFVIGRITGRKYIILDLGFMCQEFFGWYECMVIEDAASDEGKEYLFHKCKNYQDNLILLEGSDE